MANPEILHTLKRTGKSGTVLVAAVEASIARFVEIGRRAIQECPIAKGNAVAELNAGINQLEACGTVYYWQTYRLQKLSFC